MTAGKWKLENGTKVIIERIPPDEGTMVQVGAGEVFKGMLSGRVEG